MAALTVSVEDPAPPETGVGFTFAVKPAEGLVVRSTLPENPFTEPIVIVDVACTLGFSGPIVVGFALIVKSGPTTSTLTVTWCENGPLVPVTFTV